MAGAGARATALVLGLVPLACEHEDPPAPPARESLVEVDGWDYVADVDADVFGSERPADLVCDPVLGIGIEMLGGEDVLEIKTDYCDYATVRQPTAVALAPGEQLEIRMWHYDLTAMEPGSTAHLALALAGEIEWEQALSIPAAGAMVEGTVAISREIPAGAELQLHVHNHGVNAYDLVSLEVVRDGDPP